LIGTSRTVVDRRGRTADAPSDRREHAGGRTRGLGNIFIDEVTCILARSCRKLQLRHASGIHKGQRMEALTSKQVMERLDKAGAYLAAMAEDAADPSISKLAFVIRGFVIEARRLVGESPRQSRDDGPFAAPSDGVPGGSEEGPPLRRAPAPWSPRVYLPTSSDPSTRGL
jgi:hypothetical protein